MSTVGLWALVALLPTTAIAQPGASPHLAYAFPAGARRGETCELVLGGQHLKKAQGVYVAGGGVRAEIVRWYRGLTPGEYNQLRMALDEAREKTDRRRASESHGGSGGPRGGRDGGTVA
jgi:hypothetical protein